MQLYKETAHVVIELWPGSTQCFPVMDVILCAWLIMSVR